MSYSRSEQLCFGARLHRSVTAGVGDLLSVLIADRWAPGSVLFNGRHSIKQYRMELQTSGKGRFSSPGSRAPRGAKP